MNKQLVVFALPVALALAACKPQPAPSDPGEASTASTPTASQSTARTEPTSTPQQGPVGGVDQPLALPDAPAAAVDTGALAGTFSDGDTVLELRADGSYLQTLNAGGSAMSADGHWAGNGANAIVLDPNSKEAADLRFEVVSADLLRGGDGREFKRVVQ